MARELDGSESQAATGVEALIPVILGGFKKQAWSQLSGLVLALVGAVAMIFLA